MLMLKGIFVITLSGVVGYCIGGTFGLGGIPIGMVNGYLLGCLLGRWIVEGRK